jgi:hypothetical protein
MEGYRPLSLVAIEPGTGLKGGEHDMQMGLMDERLTGAIPFLPGFLAEKILDFVCQVELEGGCSQALGRPFGAVGGLTGWLMSRLGIHGSTPGLELGLRNR